MSEQTNVAAAGQSSTSRPTLLALGLINKAIDSVNNKAAKLQEEYQDVAVQALMHHDSTGDVGPLNRLQAGMPKGVRNNAMAGWILAHAAVELNKDAATKKSMPFRHTKQKASKVDLGISIKWYDLMPEKAIDEVFDLSKAIEMVLRKAKADGITGIKVNGVLIDADAAKAKIAALEAFALAK